MLFEASTTYAPGEPGSGVVPYSGYQDMSLLGRYHWSQLQPYSVWAGLLVLALLAVWLHRRSGRRS